MTKPEIVPFTPIRTPIATYGTAGGCHVKHNRRSSWM
jgi:hypothetical protein